MKLKVNGKPVETESGLTVEGLLARLALPSRRIAVAVNGEVVPRGEFGAGVIDCFGFAEALVHLFERQKAGRGSARCAALAPAGRAAPARARATPVA